MKYNELLTEVRLLDFDKALNTFITIWGRFPNTAENSLAYTFLKRIITKEALKPENYIDPKKEEIHGNDWDKKDFEAGTLKQFNPSYMLQEKIKHVIDWLKDIPIDQYQSLRGIQNIDIAYEHANRYFAAKNKKASDIEDEEGREIVYTFPDGMFFAKLNSSQCLDREGKLMQHCVGSYATRVQKGSVVIYSLRDKKNQPHATLEARGKEIFQIKGKQNEAPVEKYIPYIKEFVLKNNFDVEEDEQNIGLIRLNDKLYDLYDTNNWPSKINGNIEIHGLNSLKIEKNLEVDGVFYAEYVDELYLPKIFKVQIFNIVKSKVIRYPEKFILNKWENMYQNMRDPDYLAPTYLEINDAHIDVSKFTPNMIPKFLKVDVFEHNGFEKNLPELIECDKLLMFDGTHLPKNIKFKSLKLIDTKNIKFPENIEGNLSLGGSSFLGTFPEKLTIKGNFFISSDIRDNIYLPKHMIVLGNYHAPIYPEILEIPEITIGKFTILKNLPRILKVNYLGLENIDEFPSNVLFNDARFFNCNLTMNSMNAIDSVSIYNGKIVLKNVNIKYLFAEYCTLIVEKNCNISEIEIGNETKFKISSDLKVDKFWIFKTAKGLLPDNLKSKAIYTTNRLK